MRIRNFAFGFLKLIVILAVVAAIISTALSLYYKPVLERIISQALGARVSIENIHLEVKKQTLLITGLKLYNPEGFGKDKLLADVPRIRAVFDFKNLIINKKVHIATLDIYVKILAVMKDKKANFNVEKLAIFKEDFQEIPLQVDKLILTADHVIFKDASRGARLHVEHFNVNIKNQIYQGLPSFEDITAKVISEMIKRTTIKGAKMLGGAVVIGAVGGWPLLIAGETYNVVAGKNGYEVVFDVAYEDAYKASLEAADELGKNIRQRKSSGIILASIDSMDVVIRISKKEAGKTSIFVSAKKYFFPKLNIAGGVLYEIAERLGKV